MYDANRAHAVHTIILVVRYASQCLRGVVEAEVTVDVLNSDSPSREVEAFSLSEACQRDVAGSPARRLHIVPGCRRERW